MNRISQFRTPLQIYRRLSKYLAFLQTVEPISQLCLSVQHNYTRGPLADTNVLISENPDFNYLAENQSFLITLPHHMLTLLITSKLCTENFNS